MSKKTFVMVLTCIVTMVAYFLISGFRLKWQIVFIPLAYIFVFIINKKMDL